MTSECWREIPGYEGQYEVSDHGRVRSWRYTRSAQKQDKPIYRKPSLATDGYIRYILYKDGVRTQYPAHRLVLLAFVGPSELDANHKNGIKADNRLENLEYITHRENMLHAIKVLGKKWWPEPLQPKRYEGAELDEILAEAMDTYRRAQSAKAE